MKGRPRMDGIKSVRRVFSIKDERCELLYGKIEVPEAANTDSFNNKYFNEYYKKIARCSEEWAGKFAEDEIKKELLSLSEHERKFKFRRYEYFVGYEAEEKKEGVLSVSVTFSLMRSRKVLEQKVKNDIWDTRCLLMIRHERKRKK
jgi:hypothetical protein